MNWKRAQENPFQSISTMKIRTVRRPFLPKNKMFLLQGNLDSYIFRLRWIWIHSSTTALEYYFHIFNTLYLSVLCSYVRYRLFYEKFISYLYGAHFETEHNYSLQIAFHTSVSYECVEAIGEFSSRCWHILTRSRRNVFSKWIIYTQSCIKCKIQIATLPLTADTLR